MSRLLVNHRTSPLPPLADRAAPDSLTFHRRLDGYAPSRLVELPTVAEHAGVGRLFVKAETNRFGLPAFKALGASYATHRLLATRPGTTRLVTATDGNHGRAVAWTARSLGLDATILVPAGTAAARIEGIESEGAEVRVIEGTYDDAVAAAAAMVDGGTAVVSDTSWPGYEDVPRWVAEGYATIFAELEQQLDELGDPNIDVVVVPLGVGALGAAAARHLRGGAQPGDGARLVGVEPDGAACCLAAIEAGHVVEVPGPHRSIMAGLNCGLASMQALPTLIAGFDAVVTIGDERCAAAVRALAAAGLDVGETGAATVGAVAELRATHHDAWPLPEDASVLVLVTEGVTDPAGFERIVGRRPAPQVRARTIH